MLCIIHYAQTRTEAERLRKAFSGWPRPFMQSGSCTLLASDTNNGVRSSLLPPTPVGVTIGVRALAARAQPFAALNPTGMV